MNHDLSKQISDNIRKYRTLNNLTQEQMAEKLSLDSQYYSQMERSDRRFSLDNIHAVCDLFHIGIEEIIELPRDNSREAAACDALISEINMELPQLSVKQLLILKKYITDILQFQK